MRYCIILFAFLLTISSFATGIDSLIVEYKIIDRDTKEPVVAKVVFESQPYGSKIGIKNNSAVSFRVEYDEKYLVRVQADGYQLMLLNIDYHKYPGVSHVIEEVALVKGSELGAVMVLESLNFAQASAAIPEGGKAELDDIANTMANNISMIIQLEGHTDNNGDPKLNMRLSEDRVRAAKDYLMAQGISGSRIKLKAYGGERPLSKGTSAADRASNRRVELRILQK